MYPRKPLSALAASLLFVAPAHASDPFYAAPSAAMGRTAVADGADNTAVTANPGVLGLDKTFDLAGHGLVGAFSHLEWGVSLRDSWTSNVALGVAVRRPTANPPLRFAQLPGWIEPGVDIPNKERAYVVTTALAVAALDRRLSFGLNGTVDASNDDRTGPRTTGNGDVGVGWRPVDGVTLGVVARNVLPLKGQEDYPFALAGGVRLDAPDVGAFELDVDGRFEDPGHFPVSFRTGAEWAIQGARPRLGYRYEGTAGRHWITAGIGGENEWGGLGYAVAVPVGGDLKLLSLQHEVALFLHLDKLRPEEE